eukprot:3414665-Rhodomonas_salina.1
MNFNHTSCWTHTNSRCRAWGWAHSHPRCRQPWLSSGGLMALGGVVLISEYLICIGQYQRMGGGSSEFIFGAVVAGPLLRRWKPTLFGTLSRKPQY